MIVKLQYIKEIKHTTNIKNGILVRKIPEKVVHNKQITKVDRSRQTSQEQKGDRNEQKHLESAENYDLDFSDEESLRAEVEWAEDNCEEFMSSKLAGQKKLI